jgi:hypothetical protein
VVAGQQVAGGVQRHAVLARLGEGVGGRAVIARRVQDLADPVRLAPAVHDVARHVGEHQVAAVADPDRPLGPDEALGQLLDLGVGRDDGVELRREAVDLADGLEGHGALDLADEAWEGEGVRRRRAGTERVSFPHPPTRFGRVPPSPLRERVLKTAPSASASSHRA